MRRRFFLSLIITALLAVSCASTEEESYPLPQPTADKAETLRLLKESYEESGAGAPIAYNYAYALASMGEYNKALSVVSSYLEEDPSSLRFLSLKAYIEKAALRYGEHEKTLREIIALDEANIAAAESLVNYLSVTRREEEAREVSRVILRYDSLNQTAAKTLAKTIPFYETLIEKEEEPTFYERSPEAGFIRPGADFTFRATAEELRKISRSLL